MKIQLDERRFGVKATLYALQSFVAECGGKGECQENRPDPNFFSGLWDKVEMERERIYCFRRSFAGESDNVIETLSLDGTSGTPELGKLITRKFIFHCKHIGRFIKRRSC